MIEVLERRDYHGCELRKEHLTGEDAGLLEGESVEARYSAYQFAKAVAG